MEAGKGDFGILFIFPLVEQWSHHGAEMRGSHISHETFPLFAFLFRPFRLRHFWLRIPLFIPPGSLLQRE